VRRISRPSARYRAFARPDRDRRRLDRPAENIEEAARHGIDVTRCPEPPCERNRFLVAIESSPVETPVHFLLDEHAERAEGSDRGHGRGRNGGNVWPLVPRKSHTEAANAIDVGRTRRVQIRSSLLIPRDVKITVNAGMSTRSGACKIFR
jgi:hypothetical protein